MIGGKVKVDNKSLELHAASEVGVSETTGVLLNGDEVIEHLAALALLHDQLHRQLTDCPVEHPCVQEALPYPLRSFSLSESIPEVVQVESALESTLLRSLDHQLKDFRMLIIESLEALDGEFGEKLAEEEGGVVGTAAEAPGMHDATPFDLEFSHRLSVGLLGILALSEDLVINVLINLEGKEGVVAHLIGKSIIGRRVKTLDVQSKSQE